MKTFVLAAASLAMSMSACRPATDANPPAATRETLTVERVAALPSLIGTAPTSIAWSPDSTRLAFLWNAEGWPFRNIYLVAADGTGLTRVTDLQTTDPAPPQDAGTEALAARAAARARGGVAELTWDGPDALVFVHRGRAFRVPGAAGAPPEVLPLGDGVSDVAVSPDRTHLAFLRDGDLWVWARASTTPARLTSIGLPGIATVPVGTYNRADREVGTGVRGADAAPVPLTTTAGVHVPVASLDGRSLAVV